MDFYGIFEPSVGSLQSMEVGRFLWDLNGIFEVSWALYNPWQLQDSLGFLWDLYGTLMGFLSHCNRWKLVKILQDSYGIFAGFFPNSYWFRLGLGFGGSLWDALGILS